MKLKVFILPLVLFITDKGINTMKKWLFAAIALALISVPVNAQSILQQYQPGPRLIDGNQLNLMVNQVNNLTGNGTAGSNVKLSNGTVALPSLAFYTDTDTGIYRIGANNIGVAANGAKVLDIATTGLTVTGALASTTTLAAGTSFSVATTSAFTGVATFSAIPVMPATGITLGSTTFSEATLALYTKGVAAGYKIARGETALDGSNPTPVASGLASIVACNLTIKTTSAPGLSTSVVTYDTSTSTLNMYGWKPTGAGDTTLIASAGTDTIGWICVGT